jgi:hypothetical protein
MRRFYRVATLSRQVLVEATDETEARQLGGTALRKLYPRLWKNTPLEIRTVVLATDDDIEFWHWHETMLTHERDQQIDN